MNAKGILHVTLQVLGVLLCLQKGGYLPWSGGTIPRQGTYSDWGYLLCWWYLPWLGGTYSGWGTYPSQGIPTLDGWGVSTKGSNIPVGWNLDTPCWLEGRYPLPPISWRVGFPYQLESRYSLPISWKVETPLLCQWWTK